jgi:hypothetical protein
MKEVSKEQFKDIYFSLGGGEASGWGVNYWDEHFEKGDEAGMKYMTQEPESEAHTRMMIVTDYSTNEYRLFFLTVREEEDFFDFPGKP